MQAVAKPTQSVVVDTQPRFNVVVAYEDVATSKRALQTCDLIAKTLGNDVYVSKSMWKFDVLRMPGMDALAASDADHADMIILAAHNDDIPSCVRSLIEHTPASQNKNPRALVALLDGLATTNSGGNGVRYLRDLASQRQMDFFCHTDAEDQA
ncbi:MAG TPA: hypothetical protein VEH27_00170 [Methylomirabilota bacterium]|nr:hypothetical protein [Methylomirabilota bacterium]